MKTIAERAKEYASKKADISLSDIYNEALASIYEGGYVAGATEQRKIDIERAILWLQVRSEYPFNKLEDSFRTFMEK